MGGFLGLGGSSAKTNRSQQLNAFGDLGNIFNFSLPSATSALGTAQNYWQKLVGGNRTALNTAAAPASNAALSQSDAKKRQQAAMGTARGGGTAPANQQANDTTMAKIDNLLFGAQGDAASKLASTGATELSSAGSAASNLGNLAGQKPATAGLAQQDFNAIAGAVGGFLGGL